MSSKKRPLQPKKISVKPTKFSAAPLAIPAAPLAIPAAPLAIPAAPLAIPAAPLAIPASPLAIPASRLTSTPSSADKPFFLPSGFTPNVPVTNIVDFLLRNPQKYASVLQNEPIMKKLRKNCAYVP